MSDIYRNDLHNGWKEILIASVNCNCKRRLVKNLAANQNIGGK